ncbi:MAG: hypothetical protein NTW37_00740 [Proteobacteria bacterium]|nr:hypothetical protein [Pseudomonadota bacterium]
MTEAQILELLQNLLDQAIETAEASGTVPSAVEALSWAIDTIRSHRPQ